MQPASVSFAHELHIRCSHTGILNLAAGNAMNASIERNRLGNLHVLDMEIID